MTKIGNCSTYKWQIGDVNFPISVARLFTVTVTQYQLNTRLTNVWRLADSSTVEKG